MDLEIESLLFKQVEKPKNHLLTKIHNLLKRKIYASYFCHYSPGNLEIKDLSNGSRTTKSTF